MLIKMKVNELRDGEVDFLSLVEQGANQSAFKVLKSQDGDGPSTREKIAAFIKNNCGDKAVSSPLKVSFAITTNPKHWKKFLKAHDFSTDKVIIAKSAKGLEHTIYKFDDGDDAYLMKVAPDLALGITGFSKDFSPFPGSDDFMENLGAAAFFPSLHMAQDSLAETVWSILNDAGSTADAKPKIETVLEAFREHVLFLVDFLPNSVFKMEFEGLQSEFESNTNEKSVNADVSKSNGEQDMTDLKKEAVAGDLDGLSLKEPTKEEKAIAKAAEDKRYAESAEGKEAAEEAKVAKAEEDAESKDKTEDKVTKSESKEGSKPEEKVSKKADDDEKSEAVSKDAKDSKDEKTDEKVAKSKDVDPLTKLTDAVTILAKSMVATNERLDKIEGVAQKADEDVKKTVLVDHFADLDESLAHPLSGCVGQTESC